MMLQALIEYAERGNLGDPDFEKVGVRWLIPLDLDGRLAAGPISLVEDTASKKPRPKEFIRPFTSPNELNQGDKSYFLCDTLERAALFLNENSPDSRRSQHAYFRTLLRQAAEACPNEGSKLRAVLTYLDDPAAMQELHRQLSVARAKPGDVATFSVDGAILIQLDEIRAYWQQLRAGIARSLQKGVCLATGLITEVLDTHEKIKGVPGTLPGGANFISFDKDSFCSYGLQQARNAALSVPAELKIRSALSHLIEKSREQKLVFSDTTHLHWTRKPIERDPIDLLASPNEDAVAALLKSVQSGHQSDEVDANLYYATSLSGNGARIVVRDWLEIAVPEVERNVAAWFRDLGIIRLDGAGLRRDFGIGQLLWALANPKLDNPNEAHPHGAADDLLHAALAGGTISTSILAAALRREIVDRVSGGDERGQRKALLPSRFALMKLCLLRSPNRKEHHTMTEKLNPDSKDVAYMCGQLFAVLGRLQLLALGKVGASIAERTYAGVATRPATTLGPLFSKAPAYLKKANGHFPGSGTNKQKEIERLCLRIESEGGFPQTLALEEQARFALGYYCQLAEYRARREEAEIEEQAEKIEAVD